MFIEHKPSRSRAAFSSNAVNLVRISFKKTKKDTNLETGGLMLTIYLGKNITSKIGLNKESRILFFYDDKETRKWLIKPSQGNNGYKLVDAAGSNNTGSNYLRMQLTFKVPNFKLLDTDLTVREVKYEIQDGGIIINAD